MTAIHKTARRRPRRRRAFVLLIILSMLALLVIFMVTFIIVAGQYRSAAVSSAKSTMLKDDPRKTLDGVAYQLFRDTNDPGSALRGHSLLRDMYGASVSTTIKANAPTLLAATGGQFLQFEITPFASISTISGYYNGCVLTPVSGTAKGRSMRIVGYSYSSGPPIQAFVRTFLPAGTVTGSPIPAVNDQIVINGQAFAGKGLGYNPETGKSDLRDYGLDQSAGIKPGSGTNPDTQWLWPGSDDGWSCLFPNRQGEATPVGYTSTGTKVDIASEGMNESYDAVDFQNMALAAIVFNDTNLTTPTFVEPSFHRTALVDFWFKYISKTFLSGVPAADEPIFLNPLSPSFASIPLPTRMRIAYIKSRIMMRPSSDSNPNFTGSNPAFNPFGKGLWDVDNDNDGIPDSIWIDPGLSAIADRDGRLAKPLVALLCLDLDNRLNVNAHGTFAHFGNLGSLEPSKLVLPSGTPWATALANMPKGMGYGPPEIDLRAVLSTGTAAANILTGVGAYTGRYGLDQRPGNGPLVLDDLTRIKYFDYPPNYFNTAYNTSYQSPPDLTAEGQVGLDYVGQPNFTTINGARLDVRADNPYEVDLSSNQGNDVNGKDTPFSAGELERVLRAHDRDVSLLPQRLVNVTDAAAGTGILGPPEREFNRQAITTDSYDLPVPNIVRPRDWLGNPPRTAAELVCFRVAQAMGAVYQANPAVFNARISYELSAVTTVLGASGSVVNVSIPRGLLAPELLMNVRMDVNRPFGNGVDDNGNLIVDEHWQHLGGRVASGGLLFPPPWLTSESGGLNPSGNFINEAIWLPTIPTNLDNDSRITSDSNNNNRDRDEFLARQHYARNLYVLMMALKPAGFHFSYDTVTNNEVEEDARIIAQWAVNAVDFRDADSIMTPFEYDVTPFTPHPGPDGAWGVKNVDDDGANGSDDPGEALSPGSDDCLWCVDGILGTAAAPSEDDDPTNPAYASRRRVVWGTERPELLLTETLAIHDKRTTMNSATPPQPVQRLRPRGGFFVELYNPWTSSETRKPAEFYSVYNTSNSAFEWTDGVVLNKLSGAPIVAGSPVWRLLVTEIIVDADTNQPLTDADKFYPNEYPPVTAPAKAEDRRVIYFTAGGPELSPAGKPAYHAVYGPATSGATSLRIKPGRYAVIGTQRDFISLPDPADPSTNYMAGVCNLGRNKLAAEGVDLMKADTRRIALRDGFNNGMTSCDPDLGRVYVEDNEETTFPELLPHPILASPPAGYVADEQPPIGVRVPNLEISEDTYTDEGWVPATAGDDTREGEYVPPKNPGLDPPELVSNINYRRVYLQRLANPVLPYDAITNPYRTVDSMPVPLYVFEGVRPPTSEPTFEFDTCERGDDTVVPNPRELWSTIVNTTSELDGLTSDIPDHYFTLVLRHTLGYLNEPYNARVDTNGDGTVDRRDRFVLDDGSNAALAPYRVPNDHRTNTPLAEYVGGPNTNTGGKPFPWLTWLNRPFVSPFELMLVPRERSGKLLSSFNLGPVANFYNPAVKPDTTPVRFGHLLPILGTSYANPSGPTEWGADLYKVFDLLQVPSRFVGTETWLDPAMFAQVTATGTNGTEFFHPPFNRLSNFRDPGKINLNTLYDSRIWKAIQGNLNVTAGAAETATMSDLIQSRLGTGGATMMDTNDLPTFFANPLRSADAGGLVPFTQESLAQLKSVISAQASASGNAPLLSDDDINKYYMERPNVECTLLRSSEIKPDAAPPYTNQSTRFAASGLGQFSLPTEDSSRNPYFALSPLMRLPNLVTTRSNVYAVWITVGYFEYDASNGQIGQEIGADTGSIRRHRAFYIFDRSIPVAFEAGKNHNVDRAVVVRRVIE